MQGSVCAVLKMVPELSAPKQLHAQATRSLQLQLQPLDLHGTQTRLARHSTRAPCTHLLVHPRHVRLDGLGARGARGGVERHLRRLLDVKHQHRRKDDVRAGADAGGVGRGAGGELLRALQRDLHDRRVGARAGGRAATHHSASLPAGKRSGSGRQRSLWAAPRPLSRCGITERSQVACVACIEQKEAWQVQCCETRSRIRGQACMHVCMYAPTAISISSRDCAPRTFSILTLMPASTLMDGKPQMATPMPSQLFSSRLHEK